MANSNFIVKHGLTVGEMTVDAATGNIVTTGTITASGIASESGVQTFTNKTIDLANNTITGTIAEFNTALSDGNFATTSGTETLSNKTFVAPALGTPASATLTNATGLPVSTGISGLGTGVATALAVNTGSSGAVVVNGGALGTPSSGTLTNATGLPVSTGISGLGTGVATALAVNTGSSGAVVVNGGALGTPSSGTLTNATGLPVSTGISGLGTGVATALAVNTGSSGAVVVNGGALGTPSSGTLTNATGLPVSTGISGLGTGVATALAVNTGSSGAVVVNGGALGTPSSGTLTNATGLPVSTGISGLGTGVATFLATPSSANLATMLTDEQGSGKVLFSTNPVVTGLLLADSSIVFEGATDDSYETTLTVTDPTADRTITLPDVTGTVVTTGDTGSVTNTMLAGSITNAKLVNSSITINGNAVSLGGSVSNLALTTGKLSQFAATTSAELAGVLSDETGSGALVFANSPTLVTPNLGTPSAATLTNATGLPVSTGISGFGTGVATALAVNTGTDGAFVVRGGSLGTPSAATLTNATGLPISTGVSGLGTGVATFLATPSSANFASMLTDETGTGTVVMSASPTFTGTVNAANLTLTGNLTVNGTTTTVNSTNISYVDNILELHNTSDGSPLSTDDGKDVGLRFHYYKTSDKHAFAGFANDSLAFEYYVDGTETGGVFSGTYGDFKGANHIFVGSTSGTTTLKSAAAASGTLTLPAATDTLVGRATTDTLTNKTIAAGSNTISGLTNSNLSGSAGITNANLANSSVTVNGSSISLGGSATIKASTTNALTIGTGLSGTSFDGGSAVTIAIDSTVATLTGTQTLTNKTLTSPTLTTPTLGVASATTINKVTITAPATGSTLTIAEGKTLTASNTLTFTGTDSSSVAFGAGGTVAYTANKLSAFASTSSSELAGVISDETGTGALVFANSPSLTTPAIGSGGFTLAGSTSGTTTVAASATASGTLTLPAATDTLVGRATTDTLTNKTLTSPTLTTPVLGTPSSGTLTNCTGLPISSGVSGLGTGIATFLATPSSANLASAVTDETGSGALVFASSPTLTTPTLGVASATSINKVAITAPATSATLTIADGKTLTVSNTLTLTGTDASSVAFGSGGTVAYTANKLSAFAATTSAELAGVISDETGSGALVFGTSPTFTTQITTPVIVKSGSTGVGDIGQSANTFGTVYATTFSGTSTTAKYADLAEKYSADAEYEPGTVLAFGGDAEVTVATEDATRKVAGVVTTNPAHLMNSALEGVTAAIALQGRVPCKVVGPIAKGDMMVAAGNGRARAEANPVLGSVIGKALENFEGGEGVIEVAVGRL